MYIVSYSIVDANCISVCICLFVCVTWASVCVKIPMQTYYSTSFNFSMYLTVLQQAKFCNLAKLECIFSQQCLISNIFFALTGLQLYLDTFRFTWNCNLLFHVNPIEEYIPECQYSKNPQSAHYTVDLTRLNDTESFYMAISSVSRPESRVVDTRDLICMDIMLREKVFGSLCRE